MQDLLEAERGPRLTSEDMADRFPHFISAEDRCEMEAWCPVELAAWREAVVAHYRIPSIEKRCDSFKVKAAALAALKEAYYAALTKELCR